MFPRGHRLAPIKHLTNSVLSIGGYLAFTCLKCPQCILDLNDLGDASIDWSSQRVELQHEHFE